MLYTSPVLSVFSTKLDSDIFRPEALGQTVPKTERKLKCKNENLRVKKCYMNRTWAHTCYQDVLQASHSHLWILQTLSSKVTSCAVQLLCCTDISSVCTANATLYKGIKIQMNYFTHPHLVVNLYVTLSSVDHNRRYLGVSYKGHIQHDHNLLL